MKTIMSNGNMIELDSRFSTTRRVFESNQSAGIRQKSDAIKSQVIPVQSNTCRNGGLRSRGYFKGSELTKPLISVITVVYNGREYIERAINSVLEQTYDNVEYLIIDGGSTDGTLDIIEKYDEVVDYWVSEPDHGVYDAMNKGIELFHGDYVLFLGCDDILYDVLQEVVGYFNSSSTSYYGNVILSENQRVYGGRFFPLKLFIQNIPHQAIFYSKQVFSEYSFDCKYITVADYALNLKLFSNKKYGLKYIPKTIANYNNERGLSSTLIDHQFSKDKPGIIQKHYSVFYYWFYMMLRFVFKKNKVK